MAGRGPPPPPGAPIPRRRAQSIIGMSKQVEEALSVLFTATDELRRRQADQWLQSFQSSTEAWQVATHLVSSGESEDVSLFGSTVLYNKARGGTGGGLAPRDARELRDALLELLPRFAPGRVQAQLCRTVAALVGCCEGDGAHPTITLLKSASVGAVRADALLELLTLIPTAGGWRSDGEVNAVLNMQGDLLNYAFCEGAPFPMQLPPSCAPATCSNEFRVAALKCAVAWASLPATEGLCLSMLAELPCFHPLIRGVRGDSGVLVQRHAVELCTAALDQEATSPGVRGTFLPFVGAEMTQQLIGALATSLEPLAASRRDEEDESDDEADGEAGAAVGALVGLGSALLAKASAVLVEGAASPAEALSLLRLLVLSCGHARRSVCEVGSSTATWATLLHVADEWEATLRAQLLSSMCSTVMARLQYPPDARLAQWDAQRVEEYDEWRENYLADLVCELSRHQKDAFLRALLVALEQPATQTWQQLEAALCAVRFGADVTLAHVGSDSSLHAIVGHVIARVISAPPASAASAGALLQAANFRVCGAFASFIADAGSAEVLRDTIGGAATALQQPGAPASASCAALALVHVLRAASGRVASSPPLLNAIVESLQQPMTLQHQLRCRLLEETAKCIAIMTSGQQQLLQALFAPLLVALDQLVTAAEACVTRGQLPDEAITAPLSDTLDSCASAIRPLRPIGSASLGAMLSHVWPLWLRVLATIQRAPEQPLLPALVNVGQQTLHLFGADFAPFMASTVTTLVATFQRTEAEACISLATALFSAFSDMADCEHSHILLLDDLGGVALPVVRGAPLDQLHLAGPFFELAHRYAALASGALAKSRSLPALLELAAHLISCCREPEPLRAVFDFLSAFARAARKRRPELDPVCAQLQAAAGGHMGEELVRALIGGLADSLPTSVVPLAADVLGPLLHAESWRGSVGSWAHAALAAVPVADGVPDDRTKSALLHALSTISDPLEGGNINLDATEALRGTLTSFAQLCRRMGSAADFELACYDWKPSE